MLREEVSILIVDDVNAMRIQIKELLRSFGFRKIAVAANGEEAMKMMSAEKFNLIMADWVMHPTDGVELLKFIRSHPDNMDIAFIMVTAENSKERVIEAIKAGIDDYLVKPLTPVQIQSKVYGVLLKRQVI